jgi:hypothetical protein
MLFGLLFALLCGHALADFVLQTEVMAKYKNWNEPLPHPAMPPWYYWLTAHSLIHGGVVMMITGYPMLGIAEALVHWVIDYAKIEGDTNLHVDQALHVICKFAWALLVVYG